MIRFSHTNDLKEHLGQIVSAQSENSGTWSNAQIFYHLAAAFEASCDVEPLPVGFPRVIRWIVRPFRFVVTRIRFPPWLPIPGAIAFKLQPPPHPELMEQYQRLQNAIDRFDRHIGHLQPHPVLGPFSRSEWLGFHLRHCEHHLSFIRIIDVLEPARNDLEENQRVSQSSIRRGS